MRDGQWLLASGTLVGAAIRRVYDAEDQLRTVGGFDLAVNRFVKRVHGKTLPMPRQIVFLEMNQELLVPQGLQEELTEEVEGDTDTEESIIVQRQRQIAPLRYSDRATVQGLFQKRWLLTQPYGRVSKQIETVRLKQRQAASIALTAWLREHDNKARVWKQIVNRVESWQRAYEAGELTLAALGRRADHLFATQQPEVGPKLKQLLPKLQAIEEQHSPERLGLLRPILMVSSYRYVTVNGHYGEPKFPQADYDPERAADPAYQCEMFQAFVQSQLFRHEQGLALNFGSQDYFPARNRWTQTDVEAWRKAHT